MTDVTDDGPWGVYTATCLLCDLPIVTVIEVDLVDTGQHDPFTTLCGECEAKARSWPDAHVPVLEGFTRERIGREEGT